MRIMSMACDLLGDRTHHILMVNMRSSPASLFPSVYSVFEMTQLRIAM